MANEVQEEKKKRKNIEMEQLIENHRIGDIHDKKWILRSR